MPLTAVISNWRQRLDGHRDYIAAQPRRTSSAEANNLEQVRNQLTIAQQATVQRRLKAIDQLQTVSQQTQQLISEQKTVDQRIHPACDLIGKRSRLELRAALHALETADQANAAAALVRGITQLRIDKLPEAEHELNELVSLPEPIGPIALAARAEVLARMSQTRPSKKRSGSHSHSSTPAVIMLRATHGPYWETKAIRCAKRPWNAGRSWPRTKPTNTWLGPRKHSSKAQAHPLPTPPENCSNKLAWPTTFLAAPNGTTRSL